MTDDVRKHCEFGGLAGPVADTTQRLKTAWDFACQWYQTEEIHRNINTIHAPFISSDVTSIEFAEFLASQYRVAMAKGIQIGREWDKHQQKGRWHE